MRVGFLGTGEIAKAMVMGLAGRGFDILVSRRSEATSSKLAEVLSDVRVADNAELVEASDIVVVCLMTDVAREALSALPFREDQQVISVMADASLEDVRAWVAPVHIVCITLPLPAIATGGTHLPCYPSSDAVEQLFGASNTVGTVPSEAALGAHFAATALCSVTLAQMATTRDWLAGFGMDAEAAEGFVASMLSGAMRDADGGIDAALARLNTDGGLNQTLRKHMEPAQDQLREGLDGFRARLGLPEA